MEIHGTFNYSFLLFFVSNISIFSSFLYVKKNTASASCFSPITAWSLCSPSQSSCKRMSGLHLESKVPICSLSTCLSSTFCPHPAGFFTPITLLKPLLPKLVMAFILSSPYTCVLWPQRSTQYCGPLQPLKHSLSELPAHHPSVVLLLLGCLASVSPFLTVLSSSVWP